MAQITDSAIAAIFQPDPATTRALVVAGACGNVGFGKLGQFARLLVRHGVPLVALDPSGDIQQIRERLRKAYGGRFATDEVDRILANIHIVRGDVSDIPEPIGIGFVFEAIPERLSIKHAFYRAIRSRDPDAFIFSATSGFPSTMLFEGLLGAHRCGVMHPFFPHLTNKLWEVPRRDAITGREEFKTVTRFLQRLGMNLIDVRDVPAFAADRLFCGMMLEAVRVHVDLDLSPAQVDDVCKKTFGTSPFFVHNLIAGANYLSAHCMELLATELPSSAFAIPSAWQPYIEDPKRQWPYERGQTCPVEKFAAARDRMLGMLIGLTSYMLEHEIAAIDAINFLCENALAFREGMPAHIERIGFEPAKVLARRFVEEQEITNGDAFAPIGALDPERIAGWHRVYVDATLHDGVGLLSLKRASLNDTFIAEFDRAYEQLNRDPDVGAIVIAPDGKFSREFGHGADLNAFVPVLGDERAALALIQRWKRTLGKLRSGKPTVAALVGRVLGGSLELASTCHARIAGAHTRLQFPETTVGVIPGLGGCHQLHRSSGAEHWPRINEVLLTGHGFAAEEAARWGFISDVVAIPDLPRKSMELARALAQRSQPLPPFREGPAEVSVSRDVATQNEAQVVLDADLRELLATTITDANALPYADGSNLEEQRAAHSLAISSSKIGVAAMLRGKPPQFERPLEG